MILKIMKRLRKYCNEYQEIENYEEAVRSPEGYDLHHRKEIETLEDGTVVLRSKKELIEMDLYYHRPPEELIFLKRTEHNSLDKQSAESRAKISATLKGHSVSSESRIKMAAAKKGMTGDRCNAWKGDLVTDHQKRVRLRRQKQRELLSNH